MGRYGIEVFLEKIGKLQPEEFIGICRIMNVKLVEEEEKRVKKNKKDKTEEKDLDYNDFVQDA